MTATTVIGIISSILALARFFVDYAQKQKWIEEGAAGVILKALKDSDDAIAKAKEARKAVRDTIARDPDSILRDDDGFRRPGD